MEQTYEEILCEIQENILLSSNRTEENFYKNIVKDIFLKKMKYTDKRYDFCEKESEGFARAAFYNHNLIVKGAVEENYEKELAQLLSKINDGCDKIKCEWGILIHPKGIWLINSDIKTDNNSVFRKKQIVLEIIFGLNTDQKYFKYFSAENVIGSKQNASFYRDIITYKNTVYKGKAESWKAYHSSLKRLFDYYAEYKGNYSDYGERVYDQIDPAFFLEYVGRATNTKSKSSVKNAYHYVKGFVNEHATQGGLNKSAEEIINEIPNLSSKSGWIDIMNVDKLKTALATFEKGRHELRNKAILLLLLAFGMERRKICTLEWKKNYIKVSEEKRALKVDEKVYPIPGYLAQILDALKKEDSLEKYIFYSKDGKEPLKVGAINNILSSIAESLPDEEFYCQLTPANIRRSLARYLLRNGYHMEDIFYLMDIQGYKLSSYLTGEDIIKAHWAHKNDIDCPPDCHPLESFFNKLKGE